MTTDQNRFASIRTIVKLAFARLLALILSVCPMFVAAQQEPQSKEEKQDEKKADAFKVQKLTTGMGLYSIGPVSPDKKYILLIARKPDASPNLYMMNLADHSIRPPLTSLKWGVSDPQWARDGQSIAFAGMNESAGFPEIFILDVKTGVSRQLTKNAFSDKEPVFTPDGKRLLYTSDESPLPDAAFGILHVASIAVSGGKPQFFTEDECSSIHPVISADGKSILLVKVSDNSGRHSLWEYGLGGEPRRDLTELKFARIRDYIPIGVGGAMVLWAQEEAEQRDDIYLRDPKNGHVRELPEPDLPKRSPTVSPDGKLIAFVGAARFGSQLFLYDIETNTIKELTFKPANTHSPRFISNTEILFGSDRDKQSELYLIDISQPAEQKKR